MNAVNRLELSNWIKRSNALSWMTRGAMKLPRMFSGSMKAPMGGTMAPSVPPSWKPRSSGQKLNVNLGPISAMGNPSQFSQGMSAKPKGIFAGSKKLQIRPAQ